MKTLGMLFGISALLAQTTASAQELHPTYRLEPGFAVALNSPQMDLYGPGGAASGKVAFNLTPWFDVDPSVETVQLAGANNGRGVGGTWAFGAGARIKRPHNLPNNDYWEAASPWVDGDLQYFNTGGLGRLGASVAVGVAGPLDDARHWWIGPFVRFSEITDGTSVGGTVGRDTRDARIFILGVSLEFDPAGYQQPVAPVVLTENKDPEVKAPVSTPRPEVPSHKMYMVQTRQMSGKVQFDWDSSALHSEDQNGLATLATGLIKYLTPSGPHEVQFEKLEVDGHASDEGHKWAEEHNNKLAEARAQAVADYLISKGVPADKLVVKGFGTSRPIADNATEAGRVANRRVEFELTVSFTQDSAKGAP